MSWDDAGKAKQVHKFIKNGLLVPEDLKHNEIRLLREYYPSDYHYIKWWLETRQEMIENGEWTEGHEPPDNDRRIKRYERGEGIVDPWEK